MYILNPRIISRNIKQRGVANKPIVKVKLKPKNAQLIQNKAGKNEKWTNGTNKRQIEKLYT